MESESVFEYIRKLVNLETRSPRSIIWFPEISTPLFQTISGLDQPLQLLASYFEATRNNFLVFAERLEDVVADVIAKYGVRRSESSSAADNTSECDDASDIGSSDIGSSVALCHILRQIACGAEINRF